MSFDKRVLVAAEMAERILGVEGLDKAGRDGAGYALVTLIRKHLKDVRVLGNGHYGVAVALPDGNVLKIALDPQDAYPAYAQWAQLNPSDHIPDIYYTCRVRQDFFVCAMPMYESILGTVWADAWFASLVGANNDSLHRAFLRIEGQIGYVGKRDLHSGNGMWDARRQQIVITDPFAALCVAQEQAEAEITGRQYRPQITEQLDWVADAIEEEQEAELARGFLDMGTRKIGGGRTFGNPPQFPKVDGFFRMGFSAVKQLMERLPSVQWQQPAERNLDLLAKQHGLGNKAFPELQPHLQARVVLNKPRWQNVWK